MITKKIIKVKKVTAEQLLWLMYASIDLCCFYQTNINGNELEDSIIIKRSIADSLQLDFNKRLLRGVEKHNINLQTHEAYVLLQSIYQYENKVPLTCIYSIKESIDQQLK